MPFTLAHPAAVLPLRRLGVALPLPPLVAGSMAPDLPYFLPLPGSLRGWTHSLGGAFTIDVVLAVGLLLFGVFVAEPVAALLPARWAVLARSWTSAAWPRSLVGVLGWYAALVVGALTHVVWDAFTHPDGWVVQRWSLLRHEFAGLPVEQWLQYLFSGLGMALVAYALWRGAGRVTAPPASSQPAASRVLLVGAIAGAGVVGGLLKAVTHQHDSNLRFDLATGVGAGLAAGLLVYATAVQGRRLVAA